MYIKRNLEDKLLKYLEAPEVIAVLGPRQSGKTTMIKNIINSLPQSKSLSFDDQETLNLFEKNTKDFINLYIKGNKYLFIDEFQYSKNGGKILKFIYDSEKIKIIISGSSAIDITLKTAKYLVGRVLMFNLYPFDFQEFLSAKDENYSKLYNDYLNKFNIYEGGSKDISISNEIHEKLNKFYEEYINFGGYPRVVLEENIETKKEILKNIYNLYFLREVRDILGLIDDYKLDNLIKALALQTGNLIEYNELSRISDFSYPSLKKYLNFLEKTYICRFVRPFFKNKRNEIVKNPKEYFFDTGLRNAAINDFRPFKERPDKGRLFENGLAMQFIKKGFDFNFWRDKQKNEMDFILRLLNGKIAAIESKSYIKNREFNNTRVFQEKYPEIEVYVSYEDKDEFLKNQNISNFPVYLF